MPTPYKYVKAPPDYPGKVYSCGKRTLEHHLVWWKKTGKVVPTGSVVHHINGNTWDNRPSNLELLEHGAHTRRHHDRGQVVLHCAECGIKFVRQKSAYLLRKNNGQLKVFCSKRCSAISHLGCKPLPNHGDYKRYRKGCRCKKCRRANAKRMSIARAQGRTGRH